MDATQQKLEKQVDLFEDLTEESRIVATPSFQIGDYTVHSKIADKPVFFATLDGQEVIIKRANNGMSAEEKEHFAKLKPDERIEYRKIKALTEFELMRYEHYIQTQLDHPHIVKSKLVRNQGILHLVTPNAGITLDDFCEEQLTRDITQTREVQEHLTILYQIAQALTYCHGQKIAHLDVKPGNIVVDKNGRATLIDFGSARKLDATPHPIIHNVITFTNTHAAKEQTEGKYSDKSDVFAYAILAYELMTARDAYGRKKDNSIDYDKPICDIRKISQYGTIAYLIMDALKINPAERPPMQRMAEALERLV